MNTRITVTGSLTFDIEDTTPVHQTEGLQQASTADKLEGGALPVLNDPGDASEIDMVLRELRDTDALSSNLVATPDDVDIVHRAIREHRLSYTTAGQIIRASLAVAGPDAGVIDLGNDVERILFANAIDNARQEDKMFDKDYVDISDKKAADFYWTSGLPVGVPLEEYPEGSLIEAPVPQPYAPYEQTEAIPDSVNALIKQR